ncbi:MAG: hypothetical protein ACRDSH_12625 [Pseudonocardiaceae bacterium]
MSAAGWVFLLVCAVVIAVVALSLVKVIAQLRHVAWTLGAIIVGVNAIAYQTRTVPEVIPSVNANLKPVRDMAETI